MRIAWSIHLYPPHHNCGSEYVAHNLNKYLISKGHQVRVLLHQGKDIDTPYMYEGVEVFSGRLVQRVDAYQWADVLMTHLDYTQYTIAMAMSAKRPLIHTIHNDISYMSIENAVRGQHIIYNSKWIADKLNYKWPGIVMHPPCDINHYNVNENPINNEYITLVSCNERKGGYRFYEIARAMPERKFLAVRGSYDNPGPLGLNQDEIIARLATLPNVTIIPNSPDILSTYQRTRLLLMPSDYESWGRTATEAMCNGIPVICTPTLGLKENCQKAAEYVGQEIPDAMPGEAAVTLGSVEDWVAAIRKFDNDKYYNKKSLLCRQRSAELDPIKELQAIEDFICNARF